MSKELEHMLHQIARQSFFLSVELLLLSSSIQALSWTTWTHKTAEHAWATAARGKHDFFPFRKVVHLNSMDCQLRAREKKTWDIRCRASASKLEQQGGILVEE
jgi:hypothetical protein